MTKQSWTLLVLVAVVVDIAGILIGNQLIEYIFKPFIVISVAGLFISGTTFTGSALKKWILYALLFSLVGDILLMFQKEKPVFFLFGLGSFLVAHIFYIIYFHRVRVGENVKPKIWPAFIVVIYYLALIVFLSPHLKDMKLPVRIYGIVISFMFMLAMHMVFIKNRAAGIEMMMGGLLFVISDSVLAIDRFYSSLAFAGPVIILTYAGAQLLIGSGAVKYITSNLKE